MTDIRLVPLDQDDREQFILDNQEAFNYGALEEFGMRDDHLEEDGQIISRETIEKSINNNMNYSLTAELLFVHINTIRKRLDRIMEDAAFEGVDWNNTVERVKMILLLQFLEAVE